MSDKPQLPGYNVDDDIHDDSDNDDAHHIDFVTAEPERADDLVWPARAASGDALSSVPTVFSPTRQGSTQSRKTSSSQQEAGEEHPTAANAFTTTPSPTVRSPVDEFADPKISGLHAIFPDFEAVIL